MLCQYIRKVIAVRLLYKFYIITLKREEYIVNKKCNIILLIKFLQTYVHILAFTLFNFSLATQSIAILEKLKFSLLPVEHTFFRLLKINLFRWWIYYWTTFTPIFPLFHSKILDQSEQFSIILYSDNNSLIQFSFFNFNLSVFEFLSLTLKHKRS